MDLLFVFRCLRYAISSKGRRFNETRGRANSSFQSDSFDLAHLLAHQNRLFSIYLTFHVCAPPDTNQTLESRTNTNKSSQPLHISFISACALCLRFFSTSIASSSWTEFSEAGVYLNFSTSRSRACRLIFRRPAQEGS